MFNFSFLVCMPVCLVKEKREKTCDNNNNFSLIWTGRDVYKTLVIERTRSIWEGFVCAKRRRRCRIELNRLKSSVKTLLLHNQTNSRDVETLSSSSNCSRNDGFDRFILFSLSSVNEHFCCIFTSSKDEDEEEEERDEGRVFFHWPIYLSIEDYTHTKRVESVGIFPFSFLWFNLTWRANFNQMSTLPLSEETAISDQSMTCEIEHEWKTKDSEKKAMPTFTNHWREFLSNFI